ncbi:winged helix-turn-helix transcriptional regulator [Sulfurisphaera ohwakuensis]|uniref:Transcriptional regulator n=1 Tax=Sulfurisphaera ohwakuensis TaxID=69656 RepID=A0A650CFV7_SULOH|nr:helix-turn-helix domain-containing protein [Sulfurisphaera ohwakuensis]MBB5254472.1 DNA-binding HxlR family transcriptional regulator [Sulfurisphaera ohwakuensis]QGR16724.1 transcriptional regulator [Sulfurisphaera ohwakuensis]
MEECCFREDQELCIFYSSRLLELIMKKYTYAILVVLDKYGKLRFNEIQRKILGLTQRTLSIRLKELEKVKLIKRVVEPSEPVKVYYTITTEGKAVKNAMQILVSLANLLDNNKDAYLC